MALNKDGDKNRRQFTSKTVGGKFFCNCLSGVAPFVAVCKCMYVPVRYNQGTASMYAVVHDCTRTLRALSKCILSCVFCDLCPACHTLRKGLENESLDLFQFITTVFVLGHGGDNTATIGIAVGVSVLCIAVVVIVIAVLIYCYKVKHRY